jgi:class 3 adenylate cyclase
MNSEEMGRVRQAIEDGLDRAERNWDEVGGHLVEGMLKKAMEGQDVFDGVDSNIPGHPSVSAGQPKVDEFLALVVDMRGSTQRLKTQITSAKVSGLQRVYYETSALLPAVAVTCDFQEGKVTEYLGDGCLVLFGVDKSDRTASVKLAYRAAKNCIGDTRQLINDAIKRRYKLPEISLGAGLAMSRAMVTLVGVPGNFQPKAIGACVWDATKLSSGTNAVHVSPQIRTAWPKEKGGTMRFVPLSVKHVEGYRMFSESARASAT